MGLKIPPKCPNDLLLNFTVHYNFDHFLNFMPHLNFDYFFNFVLHFIGEQGLAALAFGKFEEEYEIEGGS